MSVRAKHGHYHKPVGHLQFADVYRVLDLFGVVNAAIAHAIKKLLVAGGRGAGKDISQDVQEAIDSLQRWQEMQAEDATRMAGEFRPTTLGADDFARPVFAGDAAPIDQIAELAKALERSGAKGPFFSRLSDGRIFRAHKQGDEWRVFPSTQEELDKALPPDHLLRDPAQPRTRVRLHVNPADVAKAGRMAKARKVRKARKALRAGARIR